MILTQRIIEHGGELVCECPVSQRQGEEGGRQEGVATVIHGYDPTILVSHKVDELQVRYAKAQAVVVDLVAEVNTPLPACDGENLWQGLSSGQRPRCERDKARREKREDLPRSHGPLTPRRTRTGWRTSGRRRRGARSGLLRRAQASSWGPGWR